MLVLTSLQQQNSSDIIAGRQEDYEGEFKWGVTTKVAYFPKDINAEFTTDETIVEWLTPYSPES